MLNPFYCFKRGNKLRGEPICMLLSIVCVTVVSAQSCQYQTAAQAELRGTEFGGWGGIVRIKHCVIF